MKKLLLFSALFVSLTGIAQDQIKVLQFNKTVVAGGAACSGVSSTTEIILVINESGVKFKKYSPTDTNKIKCVSFRKNDTICITQQSYRPYYQPYDRGLENGNSWSYTVEKAPKGALNKARDQWGRYQADVETGETIEFEFQGKTITAKLPPALVNEIALP